MRSLARVAVAVLIGMFAVAAPASAEPMYGAIARTAAVDQEMADAGLRATTSAPFGMSFTGGANPTQEPDFSLYGGGANGAGIGVMPWLGAYNDEDGAAPCQFQRSDESVQSRVRELDQWDNVVAWQIADEPHVDECTGGLTGAGFVHSGTLAAGTGSTTSGSATLSSVTLISGAAWRAGERIFGAGIPTGATIAAVGSDTLTISEPATATGTAVELYNSADASYAHGSGSTTSGSATVAPVSASIGAFAVGKCVWGAGIPEGTTITAVDAGAGWLTLSQAATATGTVDPLRSSSDPLCGTTTRTVEQFQERYRVIKAADNPDGAGDEPPIVLPHFRGEEFEALFAAGGDRTADILGVVQYPCNHPAGDCVYANLEADIETAEAAGWPADRLAGWVQAFGDDPTALSSWYLMPGASQLQEMIDRFRSHGIEHLWFYTWDEHDEWMDLGSAFAANPLDPVIATVRANAPGSCRVALDQLDVEARGARRVKLDVEVLAGAVTKVEYLVDGVEVEEDTTAPIWDETWDSTTVADGPHDVAARATCSDGTFVTPAQELILTAGR